MLHPDRNPIICVGPDGLHLMDLLNPNPASFDLRHIFTALSRQDRYTGHGAFPYSVGEHLLTCLRIAGRCESLREDSAFLWAVLMHDAAEGYLGDVSSPLKALLPDYKAIEARMEEAIFSRYKVQMGLFRDAVKRVDRQALALERAVLFPRSQPFAIELPGPAVQVRSWMTPEEVAKTLLLYASIFVPDGVAVPE